MSKDTPKDDKQKPIPGPVKDFSGNPIKTILSREVFYAGQNIVEQGQEGVRAYFIQHGRVGIYVSDKGHELKVAEIGPGDIFGEMALISKDLRSATARALEDCTVAIISEGELEQKLTELEDPAVASLIRVLVDRLRQANKGQIQQYVEKADFQDKLMGLYDRTQMGVDKEKREAFRNEMEPLLQKIQDVLDKYA